MHHRAGVTLEQLHFAAGVEFLPVALDERGLVIERVALAGGARHEQLHNPLRLGAMMQAAVEIRAAGRGRGEQAVLAEQGSHRNSAESAAETPEKFPAVNEPRVIRAKLKRRLLRGADVAGGLHQSANMNSEVLKRTRQTLAIPFCWANGTSCLNSFGVGGRFKAS